MAEKLALIVDDSATARIMLARVLSSMDVAAKHAKSGEEALHLLGIERPDLIFLDHLMPGMDGFQTLKAIKSNPATRDIPVIMYTSQNALRYQEEAKALGAAGVVTKQVDRDQLYLLVERIWMQHEIAETAPEVELAVEEPVKLTVGESRIVRLHPGDADHGAARPSAESPAPASPGLRLVSSTQTAPHPEIEPPVSAPPAGSLRHWLGLFLALIAILLSGYTLYVLQHQSAQVDQMAEQLETTRRIMQEMLDILERSQ